MKKVLVAEDEESIREFIVINLTRSGYDVMQAENGAVALDIFQKEGGDFDVAILDIMMPEMDGLTVCKELRQRSSDLGIIMLSARTQEMDKVTGVDTDGLGGVLQTNEENDHGIFVFTDNSQELISVEVEKTQEDTPSRIISSLATMQRLKCAPDAEYLNQKLYTILFDAAKRAYQKHVAHYITASDSSKKSKNALAVLDDLRSRSDVTHESKKLLKQIEKLVRAKDNYVIKQVMRFENYQGSLFGTDEDINALLESALSNLANRAQAKRGEAKLVLYSETRNNN